MNRLLLLAALLAVLAGSGGCLGPLTPSRASRYVETDAPVVRVENSSNCCVTVRIEKGDGQLVDTSGGGDSNSATQDVRPTTTVTVPAQTARAGIASLVDGILALFGRASGAAAAAPAGECAGGQCAEPAGGCADGACHD